MKNLPYGVLGKCCNNSPEYIVKFNGAPSPDYVVLLCNNHLNQKPFNQNIIRITKLNDAKNFFGGTKNE